MRILLHICCGPCAIMPLRVLAEEGHEIAGYFYNPNIHPLAEYMKRREGALRAAQLCFAPDRAQTARDSGIPVFFSASADEYDAQSWCRAALAQQDLAPYGRCAYCQRSRMEHTAHFAKAHGFAAFTTSLLYSRQQQHEGVIQAGEAASAVAGLPFLYRDFRPYWQEGMEESKKCGIYRQQYCGCVFSEEERFRAAFTRMQVKSFLQ